MSLDSPDLYSDVDTERTVLGAVVRDNAALNTLASVLVPKHFTQERHRYIWGATLKLYERSQPVDRLTLGMELADDIERAGGMAYLAGLDDGVPRIASIGPWAKILIDKARRRAVRKFAGDLLTEADGGAEVEDMIERFQEQLTKLQVSRTDGVIPIRETLKAADKLLRQFSESPDGLLGIPCGLPDVDRLLCGWQPGALYVIAARPGRGKSVFCAQSAVNAAVRGHKVLYVGMEMKPSATTVRMWCAEAGVDRFDLRLRAGETGRGKFTDSWASLGRALSRLQGVDIWFDQREAPTVAQIKALTKQHQAARGCDLLIVDYLQRCTLREGADQWIAVGDIAKGLKSLAQAVNIPVIAACQLNAEAQEKRPTQANLAQARGTISAEADVIAFLHPDEPQKWKDHDSPKVTMIVDKHRDGATADIPLSFERSRSRFVCNYGAEDFNVA